MKDSTVSASFYRTLRADLFASPVLWLLLVGVLCAIILGAMWWMTRRHTVFLTTTSPDNTYSVRLKGDKGRAFVVPNKVTADVLKLGQPFVSDISLHSTADAFDLSFEAGFPDVRWLNDTAVEFYRAQYFEKGMDSLIVSNKADKTIKYLCVQAHNKFLLFEIQPGASVSVQIPAPRGDSQWIAVQGAFTDGTEIPFNSKTFDRRSTQRQRSAYALAITTSSSVISVM